MRRTLGGFRDGALVNSGVGWDEFRMQLRCRILQGYRQRQSQSPWINRCNDRAPRDATSRKIETVAVTSERTALASCYFKSHMYTDANCEHRQVANAIIRRISGVDLSFSLWRHGSWARLWPRTRNVQSVGLNPVVRIGSRHCLRHLPIKVGRVKVSAYLWNGTSTAGCAADAKAGIGDEMKSLLGNECDTDVYCCCADAADAAGALQSTVVY